MHYHLIGIAGTAMGSLAGLLKHKGHTVTGSDEGVYPPMSDVLDACGIAYADSFDPANLEPAPDLVVVGNAVSRGNVELEAVLERGLRYTSAARTLKEEFLWEPHVLAVAGTHGKTTTASLLAWVLECSERSPSFLIGGVAENFGSSFRLTEGDLFVVEADEYDTAYFDKGPKMWHYLPRTAVVTNVEFDHADIYRDERAYRFAFERFVNLVPRNGRLVSGWGSAVERALAERSWAPVDSFGIGTDAREGALSNASGEPGTVALPRWRAEDVDFAPEGTTFTLLEDGHDHGRLATPLLGAFNVRNCLAAVAAARAVDASWEGIREGLSSFRSVRRRMEVRGTAGGVSVIDDFAHHPTAVRGTLDAARQRFPGSRVWAVFEPRSYTAQRRESQEGFRRALGSADEVVLAALHRPERYDEGTGLDPHTLVADLVSDRVSARFVPEVEEIVQVVSEEVRPGDVVVVMSNGGFGGIHARILERLKGRTPF